MLTGWQLVNSKWYFMNQNGTLLTGWQFINGKWYYLTADGSMLASAQTPDGYKVDANGALDSVKVKCIEGQSHSGFALFTPVAIYYNRTYVLYALLHDLIIFN